MSNHILKKYISTIPSSFKPETNPVVLALLTALSSSDEFLEEQVQNGKDQLFVATATGRGLDRIANSFGVARPPGLGLEDTQFQKLIPNLSLKARQIKKIFYDTSDVFWGELFSRANITTSNTSPFNLVIGDELKIEVDNGTEQLLKVRTGDISLSGAATAEEVKTWLERLKGITVEILVEPGTGDQSINIRTNSPGSSGNLNIISSSSIGTGKLDLILGSVDILDLAQRFSIYNINHNELVIEIPAIIPALRRTLLGSHHFHASAVIEAPKPTENGVWKGSFLFGPSGTYGGYTITEQKVLLQSTIVSGDVLTTISVDDTSNFSSPTGNLIFDFGLSSEEVPIAYQGILNSNTVAIDPSYVFTKNHSIGSNVNVISKKLPLSPKVLGSDFAIYLPSPVGARLAVQEILQKLTAAGIILKFIVLAPDYKYRIDNPFEPLSNSC